MQKTPLYVFNEEYKKQTTKYKTKGCDHLREFLKDKTFDNFTWHDIWVHAYHIKLKSKDYRESYIRMCIRFVIYTAQHGYYKADDLEEILENADKFENFISSSTCGIIYHCELDDFRPSDLFVANNKHRKSSYIVLHNQSKEQKALIKELLDNNVLNIKNCVTTDFMMKFIEIVFDKEDGLKTFENHNDDTIIYYLTKIKNQVKPEPIGSYPNGAILMMDDVENVFCYIQNKYGEDNYTMLKTNVIKHLVFTHAFYEGYHFVSYSPFGKPTYKDKLCLINQETSGGNLELTTLDLSEINNNLLKQYYIDCFWYDMNHHFAKRKTSYKYVYEFLKVIDRNDIHVNINDVIKIRALINSENIKQQTKVKHISMIRFFVKYLEEIKNVKVDSVCYPMLDCRESYVQTPYKDTYTGDEIKKILNLIKEKIKTNKNFKDRFTLMYYAINILCLSDIRISSILRIRTDSVVEIINHKGIKEYKISLPSKTSGVDDEEYNITKEVKSIIDEVTNYTEKYRSTLSTFEKDYIFTFKYKNAPLILKSDNICNSLRRICKNNNLPYYQLSGFRNYYMNKVTNYVVKKNYDPIVIQKLSSHTNAIHFKNYSKIDLTDFFNKYFYTEIGNLQFTGKVSEKDNSNNKNIVSNGTGYCDLEHCKLTGCLDCKMCEHFVTTVAFIDKFLEEIKQIDEKCRNETIPHEKEFLQSIKKLDVAYLKALYEEKQRNDQSNKS